MHLSGDIEYNLALKFNSDIISWIEVCSNTYI